MNSGKLLFLAVLVLLAGQLALAAEQPAGEESDGAINITIFYGRECPYCHKTMALLEEIKAENPAVRVEDFEIYHNTENLALYRETLEKYGFDPNRIRVPLTIVEDRPIFGYAPGDIKAAVDACDVIVDENAACPADPETPETISHFLFGTIDLKGMSLPVLTIVLGIADGFNPCAMWVLIYLIALLVETKDKRKIWLIVGTFVLASAVLYFIFLTAWLNLFLFIGFLSPIQILVGLIAIGTGIWHLRTHLRKKEAVCEVTNEGQRKKVTDRLNELTKKSIVPATILGIILLAFTVNLIEFVCSAGIPAVFTKILTMSQLSTMEYYGYILLYDLFFMLDDILIFGGAALTLQHVDITGKYVKVAGIIGGILLLILGIVLIFFPQALAFI